jgi:hypothetical protein
MASTPAAPAEIKQLPSYFPTFEPACKDAAHAFFACFDAHAVMAHERDTATPRGALAKCQDTLRAYIACHEAQQKKPAASGWLW